ncbi:MAG: phytanoyl-CoA dioxygenase family protein [Planctomycetota bacterium]|nr:phytanoyl-CoA dioxygenase family protein [Planctomycetota bacterium]
MGYKVFSKGEIEQFIEDGYVVLREAFPGSVAAEVRARLWEKMGLRPDDPSGWKEPVVHIREALGGPPFSLAWTQRVWDAFDDLLGAGRYLKKDTLGWFPVAFPGFDAPPWKPPEKGWHVDGIQFHHHVYSRDQGLLPIVILSDIGPGDGGTAIDLGSHKLAARIMAESEPEGLEIKELCARVAKHPFKRVVEANGRAGDMFLHHPFIRHARSANTGKSVRFICNPCIVLKEQMNLKRANPAEYSPVERAIVEALS